MPEKNKPPFSVTGPATGLVYRFDAACAPRVQEANHDRFTRNVVVRAEDVFAQSAALCTKAESVLSAMSKPEGNPAQEDLYFYALGREFSPARLLREMAATPDAASRQDMMDGAMDAMVWDNKPDNMIALFNTAKTVKAGAEMLCRLVNAAGAETRHLTHLAKERIAHDGEETGWTRAVLEQSRLKIVPFEGRTAIAAILDRLPEKTFTPVPPARRTWDSMRRR